MIDVTVIARIAEADALAVEWRALLARAEDATPTKTPLWCLTWWRVFGSTGGRRMRLVAMRAKEDGRLIGVAPLLRRVAMRRRALPIRRLELIATGEAEADEICSDYVGIIAERGSEERVAEALASAIARGELGTWDELLMPAMRAEDAVATALAGALERCGARASVEHFGACPLVPLPASWDAYLKALSRENRYLVTRSLRELESFSAPDGYVLTRARDPHDLAEGRRVLHALHGERWSRGSEGGGGVFASPRFARFHDLVMPKLMADPRDGGLELTWLSVRGRPIAIAYNITYGDRVFFYQSGRALELPKGVRPGIALHALAIQRAIAEKRREYDFLNGEAQYKTQLALASRELVTLRAVAPSPRARVLEALRVKLDRAAELWRDARYHLRSARRSA
jgi:CelD/BcsL family acetyltransferase involved in cellulose biosynthesis